MKNINIDQLFNAEKSSSTELDKQSVAHMITKLPSLGPPAGSMFNISLFNSKYIIMISIPTILVLAALMIFTDGNQEDYAESDAQKLNTENLVTEQIPAAIKDTAQSQITKVKEVAEVKAMQTTVLKSDSNELIKNKTIAEPAKTFTEVKTKQESNLVKSEKESTENAVSDPAINSGGQKLSPQLVVNKPSISGLQARRIKKLLYKHLRKDGIIHFRGGYVEVELPGNEIIVNGTTLNSGLYKKYKDLLLEVGTGKNKRIKMNAEYIKIGDFTEEGFRGIGFGRFTETFVESDSISLDEFFDTRSLDEILLENETNPFEDKQDLIIEAEIEGLNDYVDLIFENSDRTFKKNWFGGTQLKYPILKNLHKELYQQLIKDGYVSNKDEFVVFELAENALLISGNKIDASKIAPYLALVAKYKLKRRENRIIKMSEHTIAFGDYQPGSFTGTFCELHYK